MSKVLVVLYLLAWLAAAVVVVACDLLTAWPVWLTPVRTPIYSALAGLVGGLLYLLRAVYLNASVHNTWSQQWVPWYLIRPITSSLSGFVAWLFLSTGLLVLGADVGDSEASAGYYALAFIAGLNVDRFLEKIESIAESAWGVRRSRASEKKQGEGGSGS